ncbi:uncharacterized protein LOC121731918 [Aricia agestis]|uniref:uncharacterized protein LOC121731918 n=1 Tax=Aricia agestis TaxID=91739 RepID=UPI001C2023BE|nr:uncharacterized protein LOC121731918 [Aricia agestis]
MGNTKSKKMQKEPGRFFEREKWKEQKREEKKKKNVNPANKRVGMKEAPISPAVALTPPVMGPGPIPAPAHVRSYDDEALDRMRYQLNNDADAFLLNNILLSVQFFENYEREIQYLRNNPVSEKQHFMDEAMVNHHKHVFCADRIHECVQEHVLYQKQKDQVEPILSPRLFIIYDNVEASEPGDTSDYSAVLDAPFYKLRIEDCKEPGYVKLKQLEVLESTLLKEETPIIRDNSEDSLYTDSEKESNASDDATYQEEIGKANKKSNGKTILLENSVNIEREKDIQLSMSNLKTENKRISISFQTQNGKAKLSNDEVNGKIDEKDASDDYESRPRKSILKNARRFSGPVKDMSVKANPNSPRHVSLENLAGEDTETSGYRSNASSRRTESSETESDYGYSTITEATTPKKVALSLQPNLAASSVLPEECWESINVKTIDWSDEDEENDTASKLSINRNLFETQHYLSSSMFMSSFVDNFILSLGSGLGLSQETIRNAMTQGASVYCDFIRNGSKVCNEVFPALLAAWPNAANQWIIRERRIIQNPRTNFSYQWPTKYMVSKTTGFGCLLVPIGYRPKRGINPDQSLQWKIIFPAAERYLESCLAHSHMRCYLFSLVLHKTFMENETSKIGIDATHIKNHLLWQCEDNYARWPEDRLGEALRLFLRNFYVHFGQSRFPNYFIENCNEFNCIPKPVLLRLQRKLADILEAPVMHMLHAINKLKYTRKDFYPTFNTWKLYQILTCRNPFRLLNPNIPVTVPNYNNESSDSDDNNIHNIWDKAKAQDKHYQWKKERQRQIKERRKASSSTKKQRISVKGDIEINKNIILPTKMEAERRRLVLEFFILHFIAMARSSEKFEALRQAVIYLEQAQRLCVLLKEEPAGDMTARDYIDIIRDKLADCQRKLVNEGGYKLQNREKKYTDVNIQTKAMRKHRPRYEHIINQDSPTDTSGIGPFTFADVHNDQAGSYDFKKLLEESKL